MVAVAPRVVVPPSGSVQTSVVSLEPVVEEVEEDLSLHFVPEPDERARSRADAEIVVDVMEEEPPEMFAGGVIDLGELVIEHLAIAMNPYPRKAGEEFPPDEVSSLIDREESVQKKETPFSVLDALKREDEGK